jgi:excisionase family DNA binding protein
MPEPNNLEWLTLGSVGTRLDVHATTVVRWINKGKLVATKTPGGQWRIKWSDVVEMMKPGTGEEKELW